MLQRLVADGISEASVHSLHGLPFAVTEQPFEVLTRGDALRVSRETVRKAIGNLAKSSQRRARRIVGPE